MPAGYACGGIPVVLSSSWEATNGSIVVLAVNPGNTTQVFHAVAASVPSAEIHEQLAPRSVFVRWVS